MKFFSVKGRLYGRLANLSGFQMGPVICAGILLRGPQALPGSVRAFPWLWISLSSVWGGATLALHNACGSHLVQVPTKKAQ